jgi:hypothetical protein
LNHLAVVHAKGQNMANPCVFCGSTTTKITKEHVPADWIGKLFDSDPLVQVESVQRDGTVKTFRIPPFEQTVRVVCEKCNTGWMSELEGKVKPKLGPMILHGRPTELDPPLQRLFATWAVKTAFMFGYFHPADKAVPDSECARLYVAQQPPRGYVVWLAHRTTYYDSTGRELLIASRGQVISTVNAASEQLAKQVKTAAAQGQKAFRVTFAIGRVVFAVFGHNFPGSFTINEPPVKVTQWIWPVQGNTTWPPSISIDALGGLDALHKALGGAL